jgi:hypothetical protein
MEKSVKETSIAFLKWVFKNCTPRSTSRDNIWKNYWKLNITGVLYTDEELFDYWSTKINKNA